MLNEMLKNEFNKVIVEAVIESKKIGYNPARFIQMFYERNNDGVELVKSLILGKEKITTGLEKLCRMNRLDLTLEAKVLRPEFSTLFEPKILNICRKRLKKLGYNS